MDTEQTFGLEIEQPRRVHHVAVVVRDLQAALGLYRDKLGLELELLMPIESDRVNSQKFYAFNAGRFYVSTNCGAAFTQTAATGLPTAGTVHFKALPGVEGDIWLGNEVTLTVNVAQEGCRHTQGTGHRSAIVPARGGPSAR